MATFGSSVGVRVPEIEEHHAPEVTQTPPVLDLYECGTSVNSCEAVQKLKMSTPPGGDLMK